MKEKENSPEKREHERYALPDRQAYSINIRLPDEENFHNTVSVNISYGGMMFISDSPYACNSRVEVLIKFLKNDEPSIALQSVVKWVDKNQSCKENKNSYCVGIQFDKMEELQEIAFKIFIDTFIINY